MTSYVILKTNYAYIYIYIPFDKKVDTSAGILSLISFEAVTENVILQHSHVKFSFKIKPLNSAVMLVENNVELMYKA